MLDKLSSLRSQMKAVRRMNRILLSAGSEAELLQQVCDLLAEMEPIGSVWIGLADEEGASIVPVARARSGRRQALQNGSPANPKTITATIPLMHGTQPIGTLNVFPRGNASLQGDEIDLLTEIAGEVAIRMAALRLEKQLRQNLDKLQRTLEGTIQAMELTVEKRDPYTAGHQRRVAKLAHAIATEMGLPDEQASGILMTAGVHDVGKICVPAEILSKPGKLSEIEFALIKVHSQAGHDILKTIEFPWPVAQAVLQHHERVDGSGYPAGLVADEILLEARIIGLADVVEAMLSHRPYRTALGIDTALDEIRRNRGVLYDTAAVDACLRLFGTGGFTLEG